MTARWRNALMHPDLSQTQVRETYRAALEESGRVARIDNTDDPLTLQIESARGNELTANLHRLFDDLVRLEPAERTSRFETQLEASLEAIADLDGELAAPSRDELVPIVKSANWLAGLPTEADLPSVAFVGDLVIVYAFDRPHSFGFAQMSDLDTLGLTADDALPLALDNLRTRLPADLTTRGDGKSMLFVAGGNFEASLILLPEVWDQIGMQLRGDVIACVLARDICLMTSTGVAGGIESLLAARSRILDEMSLDDLISATLLIRQQGTWKVHHHPTH
jgi:uncharacterized protein YtpQ (UPF0354 family)